MDPKLVLESLANERMDPRDTSLFVMACELDRIAGAFERIAAALEKGNELEATQPERMNQQMTEMFDKLRGMLGGGFPVTPYRSDALLEGAFPLVHGVGFPPAPGDEAPPVDEPHA